MSGLPLIATELRTSRIGSFVPIVDTLKPLDHLVVAVWLTIKVLVGKAFVILKKSEAASMQAVCCGRCHAR